MNAANFAQDYLINEAQSLLARMKQILPFSMSMPMVKSASINPLALREISKLLDDGKTELTKFLTDFIHEVNASKKQSNIDIKPLQAKFTMLKLRYNSVLDQLDIFADVLSQRSEHEVGAWVAGLDRFAEDGLSYGKHLYQVPPIMVYLDRGHGAAIRRARTRLPGGDKNPVAIVQIPRERMVGSGIASSLIHETGHQVAALLDWVATLRNAMQAQNSKENNKNAVAWEYYKLWISEIICDCWAVGLLGITSALGLMSVVTLPRYFQFRFDLEDPHPAPYMRVQIAIAFGKKLYPHQLWDDLWQTWQSFYPLNGLTTEQTQAIKNLEATLPTFVELVLTHRNTQTGKQRIMDLFPLAARQPKQLEILFQQWKSQPQLMKEAPSSLVFAVLGFAKAQKFISAVDESRILTQQLKDWAFRKNN
jgi:hypothetical protein